MNRKQLLLLLVLVVIVGGMGLAIYQRTSSTWEEKAAPAGKVLGDFALNDVTRVVIQYGDIVTTLVKNNDTWIVRERDDYPADFERVGSFIQRLWQLKALQEVNVGPSQLARLGLVAPSKETPNGMVRVELQNKDSKPVASLLIGKPYFKQSPEMPNAQGIPAGRYVMPAGTTTPKVSLVSERLEQADPRPMQWLDKTFLKIDRIQSVAVVSGTAQWKLSRETDSATEWKLADLKPGEEIAPAKVPAFATIFASPNFIDVFPADAKRDGFDSTATVETFDSVTYTLKFGRPEGDNLPMAIAVTAKQPAETPAKAKALEARVYLVPKASFEALWKPRADLLVEKKDPELPPLPAALQKAKPAAAPQPSPAKK